MTITTASPLPLEKSCSGEEMLNGDWKTQNISLGAILLSNGDSKASSLVSNSVPEQTTLVGVLHNVYFLSYIFITCCVELTLVFILNFVYFLRRS